MKIEPGLEEKSKELAKFHTGTVFDLIGARFEEFSKQKLIASFELNQSTRQAFGLMHGGIYAYIAESLASLGGWLNLDLEKEICVGIEINANHVKSVSSPGARIEATATPLHSGKTIQVWQVEFRDNNAELVSVSRCTLLTRVKKV
jgi:1,4-dihydroxy-2-naphthoyl-CoA hydrolase